MLTQLGEGGSATASTVLDAHMLEEAGFVIGADAAEWTHEVLLYNQTSMTH